MSEGNRKATEGRVFGYCRASTSRQVESPAIQQKIIQDYAAFMNLGEVTSWFVDPHISGAVPIGEREAGKALLARVRKGDHVVVAKLDRAFRKLKDAVTVMDEFQKVGIKLHVCNLMGGAIDLSSPMGRFLIQIIAAFAELERNFTGERIRDGMKNSKKVRKTHAHYAGYGFRWVEKVNRHTGLKERVKEENTDERSVMKHIVAWRMQDPPYTFQEIAANLQRRKIPAPQGATWDTMRVFRAFKAELALQAQEFKTKNGRPTA